MVDFLTEDSKAILLLCAVLKKNGKAQPLTPKEYNALVRWLIRENLRPADLLDEKYHAPAAMGSGVDLDRLSVLLNRGVQLGFAIENWQQSGIWVISRSDRDYPARLKRHLKDKAPPILFGAGERGLLQGGGLAIVGSRNIDGEAEKFTRDVATLCAQSRMPVVSGGAKGVDQIAMAAALDTGGVVIGILAENLLKKSLEGRNRKALASGQLLLISPYHPEARFTVGTAMGRNKLIYAMSDRALVVSAEYKKGGTWAGAEEELKRNSSRPVFVRVSGAVPQGNKKLLDLGAEPWPEKLDETSLEQSLENAARRMVSMQQPELGLFDFASRPDASFAGQEKTQPSEKADAPVAERQLVSVPPVSPSPEKAIYRAVLPIILDQLLEPATSDDLADRLNISKVQMNRWLKQAVKEGKVRKLSRPVRYCRNHSWKD